MKLGILTNNDNYPELNTIIRTIMHNTTFNTKNVQILKIKNEFDNLITHKRIFPLTLTSIHKIHNRKKTILNTSNQNNPFKYPQQHTDNNVTYHNVSNNYLTQITELALNNLIVIKNNSTLSIAHELNQKKTRIINIPKTINNNLSTTNYTFKFNSTINIYIKTLNQLKTTTKNHNHIIIIKIINQYTKHITLHTTITDKTHVALIPKLPYKIKSIKTHIRHKQNTKTHHHLIIITKNTKLKKKNYSYNTNIQTNTNTLQQLNNITNHLTHQLTKLKIKTRTLILNHLQQKKSPTYHNRILNTTFGNHTYQLTHTKQ